MHEVYNKSYTTCTSSGAGTAKLEDTKRLIRSVNRRKTDNTIVIRKQVKRTNNNDLQNNTQKSED
jgi:hypothetical protein